MTDTSTHEATLPMIQVDGANSELCEVVRQTLAGEGVTTGKVDMHFVDAEEMAALNSQHMGGSGPTDVLSFPIDGVESTDTGEPLTSVGGRHIGEIVICTEVADQQAADHMGDLDSELTLLSIHAALHLCGYDHHDPVERSEMWAREAHYLKRYQLSHPGDQR